MWRTLSVLAALCSHPCYLLCAKRGHYVGFCSRPRFSAPFQWAGSTVKFKGILLFQRGQYKCSENILYFCCAYQTPFCRELNQGCCTYSGKRGWKVSNHKGSNLLAYDFAYDLHVNGLMSKHRVVYLSLFLPLYCQDGLISLIKMNS